MNQRLSWDDVFGVEPQEEHRSPQSLAGSSLIPPPTSTQAKEQLKSTLGQRLFENLKQTHKRMHAKSTPSWEKKQLKASWDFYVSLAKQDLGLLEDSQLLLASTKSILYRLHPTQLQQFNTLFATLETLIRTYAGKMNKLRLGVRIKTNALAENILIGALHHKVLHFIQTGALQKAALMLLGYHHRYSQEQAALLDAAGNQLTCVDAEDFRVLLHRRLHGPSTLPPDWIDYTQEPTNRFLANPSLHPTPKNMLFFLHEHLEELVRTRNSLCEVQTKQQLSQLIEAFNALIDSIAQTHASIDPNDR